MKESTTYQAILQEGLVKGAVKEARKLLLRLGGKRLGRPSARAQAALAKIADRASSKRLSSGWSWWTPGPPYLRRSRAADNATALIV